jgi:uncharacterized protein (TIGR04255 family)
MSNHMRVLPVFQTPPIIETAIGVQFSPIEEWTVPLFGLYWNEIRNDFPIVEDQTPLPPHADISSGMPQASSPHLEFVTKPEARCWFINSEKNRLIQVQQNRFIVNWRKTHNKDNYPHYEQLSPFFKNEWLRYVNFLASQNLNEPPVQYCELTYINHLEQGKEWESMSDIASLFPFWSGKGSSNFLPTPETLSFDIWFALPEDRGHLNVQLQPAVRNRDQKQILQLRLVAVGRPRVSSVEGIQEWFDFGHSWVVQGFVDFTSGSTHELWGIKERK